MNGKQTNELYFIRYTYMDLFVNGNEELAKPIRNKINAAIQQNSISIAAISLWEIGMLASKNRITLGMPCLEWINQSIELTHLHIFPMTPAIAIDSCSLPGIFHGDPADRLIIATARIEAATIFTRDEKILEYSRKKYVGALRV